MRPDVIEVPLERVDAESVSRVKPTRGKEKEKQQEEFEKQARENAEGKGREENAGNKVEPKEKPAKPSDSPTSKSCTKGRRLDVLV